MSSFSVVSLFSGAGGIDLGFEAAGAKTVFAAENMPEACQTLRYNFPHTFVFGPPEYEGDVTQLSADTVWASTGLRQGDVDVVVAGPPCQPFSVAAAQRFLKRDIKFKRKGYECNNRGYLIFEALRIIKEVRPTCFLIENVEGMVTIDNGNTMKSLHDDLAAAGYTTTNPFVMNALHYRVPQYRRRMFIVGFLGDKAFSVPDKSKYNADTDHSYFRYYTVSQALYDFSYSLPNSDIRAHKEGSIERYKLLKYGQRELLGRVDRLNPLEPSKTVIAGGSAGGGRSHLHPFVARTLSVRECARLQTFPDSFVFFGKIGRQFTQVGNAVPPLLAEILAREILSQFFEYKIPVRLKCKSDYIDPIEAAIQLREWSILEHPNMLYQDISIPVHVEQRSLTI